MKKLLIISATLILLMLALAPITSSAIGWNTIVGLGKETIKPTDAYKLGTSGNEPRVYEWIPKHNNAIRCVFVSSFEKGGVSCYPVK